MRDNKRQSQEGGRIWGMKVVIAVTQCSYYHKKGKGGFEIPNLREEGITKKHGIEEIQEWSDDDAEEEDVINLTSKSNEEKYTEDEKTSPKKDEQEENVRPREEEEEPGGHDDEEEEKPPQETENSKKRKLEKDLMGKVMRSSGARYSSHRRPWKT